MKYLTLDFIDLTFAKFGKLSFHSSGSIQLQPICAVKLACIMVLQKPHSLRKVSIGGSDSNANKVVIVTKWF